MGGLECREKRRLGSFVAERFLHKVDYEVTSSSIRMLKQGQCKGFLAEKQKSSSLSEQDILLFNYGTL